MKPFFKTIGIVFGLALGISLLVSYGSLRALKASCFYKPSFLSNGVPDDHFDYVIFGASTGLTTLNTATIDSIAHTNGLNLCIDNTDLPTQYLMMQHFLAEGKTADYFVMAPANTSYDLKRLQLSDNDYRFLPYVTRDYVYGHYNRFKGSESTILKLSKWAPTLGVSYYNAELFYPSIVGLVSPKKHNRFDFRGNYSYPPKKSEDRDIDQRKPFEVQFTNAYVDSIQKLCDKHDMKLIFYFSPMVKLKANSAVHDKVVINHSALLDNERYFYDDIHVNSIGRRLCSETFANQFQELKAMLNDQAKTP